MGSGSSSAKSAAKTKDAKMTKIESPAIEDKLDKCPYPRQPSPYPDGHTMPQEKPLVTQKVMEPIKPQMPPTMNLQKLQLHRLSIISHDSCIYNNQEDPIIINEEHLEEYIKLEKEIHELEKEKVLQRLHVSVDQMQCLSSEIAVLEETKQKVDAELKSRNLSKALASSQVEAGKSLIDEIDAIESKTDKEDSSVKKTTDEKSKDKKTTNKEEELLENKKKTIELELKEKRQKHASLENDISLLNIKAAELLDKYLLQDEIIVRIFCQGCSSEEEDRLNHALQRLEDKKENIEMARRKWKEAQLLLEFACKQLAVAVQRWQGLNQIPSINLEVKYSLSDNANQSLKDAGDKLRLANDFAGQMPYCTPEELAALEAMAASTRPEMISEQHLLALDQYSDTYKRAVAMLKWFNRVLNTTINRDLVECSEEVRATSHALRKERIIILKKKMKDKLGHSIELDNDLEGEYDDKVRRLLSSCRDGNDCQVIKQTLNKMPEKKKVKRERKPKVLVNKLTQDTGSVNNSANADKNENTKMKLPIKDNNETPLLLQTKQLNLQTNSQETTTTNHSVTSINHSESKK